MGGTESVIGRHDGATLFSETFYPFQEFLIFYCVNCVTIIKLLFEF